MGASGSWAKDLDRLPVDRILPGDVLIFDPNDGAAGAAATVRLVTHDHGAALVTITTDEGVFVWPRAWTRRIHPRAADPNLLHTYRSIAARVLTDATRREVDSAALWLYRQGIPFGQARQRLAEELASQAAHPCIPPAPDSPLSYIE